MSDLSHRTAAGAGVVLPHAAPAAAVTVQVPAERLLQDWKQAYARALAYVAAHGIPAGDHAQLAAEAVDRALHSAVWEPDGDAIAETLRAVRGLLPERYPLRAAVPTPGMDPYLTWRLDAFLSARFETPPASGGVRTARALREGLGAAPPLTRRHMVPYGTRRGVLRRLFQRLRRPRRGPHPETLRQRRRRLRWTRVAHRRRFLLAVLVLIPSTIASGFMVNVLPHRGGTGLELAIVAFFGALFGWISIGFWTATLGFLSLMLRRDAFAISGATVDAVGDIDPAVRTAIVMPICEEPVDRVFAGLQAVYRSLARTGQLPRFDFFILSDSSNPTTWMKEEAAWAAWARAVDGFDRIFYRRRRVRIERKSGNVADFCRRWGAQYRYMIILDADSIMAGETLVHLVRLMEARPDAGMIQTAPSGVNRRSLLARVQQFATRVYGPVFAAGLHYWQLGDGQYWGHNTIIRIAPFMAYCGLPRLPGKPPLGGEILSHDFVEAALMGRAGWTLWLAYDLPGSYEEVPSTLLEEMKRDRRWCQGNLQHLRLLFMEGLFGAHRALFINGVLSYVSALLWFGFLTLSTAQAIRDAFTEHEYFPHGASLFPEWPVWHPDWPLYLVGVTAAILFLPKVLSIVLVVARGQRRACGGFFRLLLSVLLEIVLSSLFAPIRMVFHSRFVVQNLLGRTVTWRSQGREDAETGWVEAVRHHGADTIFASVWGLSLYWLNPHYFWWVTPIITALILSVPISVLASRVRLGERARRWGLFLTPEETAPPPELRDLDALFAAAREQDEQIVAAEHDGFVRAAVDPYVNAIQRALLGRPRSLRASIRASRRALLDRALADGPQALDLRQRKILLADPELVDALHQRVWALPDRERAARWGRPAAHA